MSEREAAYKAYQARQKSNNPSAFDTMGAFNQYYNDAQNVSSLAIPLDFGKAVPSKERAALLEQFNATTRTAPKTAIPASMQPAIAGSGFWSKLFSGMERAYNLSAQAASFALTLPEPTNPLYQDANVIKNIRESWQTARQISPGQAFQTAVTGTVLGAPLSLAEQAPVANKFIDQNALFLSSEFNLFDQEQRQKAFREQTLGRWSSFATDIVARFTLDPTLIAGKGVKAARLARKALKPGELRAALASGKTLKDSWPNLSDYKDGGSGGLVGTRSTVGFVKTSALKDMSGNFPANTEAVEAYRKSLREGKGFAIRDYEGKPFNDPIMVVYDNETGLAYVGEGNHRLQAAIAENVPYVPVRVVRGRKSEMVVDPISGRFPKQIKGNKEPEFVESYGALAGKPVSPGYVPPEMHPSYVFDADLLASPDLVLTPTTKRAERIKGTLQNFVVGTDGLNESDLFRIDSIRKSANPASMADILATANKIEDTATRHRVKTSIVQWAMGDAKAAEDVVNLSKEVAAKIGNMEDEILEAKFLGQALDKSTGKLAMDELNSGVSLEKSDVLLKEYETQLSDIYKKLNSEGILDPRRLPEVNIGSVIRQEFANSQAFIDVRAGAASIPVRVMTGFFYKRPKGWIDFTDNQSLQTLDNMLNQVRNASEGQISRYNNILTGLRTQLANAGDDKALVKSLKGQIKEVEDRIKSATFTVERKNELFAKYTSAPDAVSRANAYMQIEEELYTTIGNQFGYTKDQISKAWNTYANARARAHNLIRTRLYTAARDPNTGGPAGGVAKAVIDDDGIPLIFPAPINETQLVKQLPTLDIPTMYAALNKATRAQRFDYFGQKYRLPVSKVSKLVQFGLTKTADVREVANEMVDATDALLKFQVLARLGYPIRNVTEGNLRIAFTVGPMATMTRAAGLLKATARNILDNRFVGASNEDIFEWSNKAKMLARRDELQASLNYVDDPDLVVRQIADIDAMLAGTKKVKDIYGMGLNQIKIGDQIITYEDALGATPAQAKYINDRFIANAAKIVDDHFSEFSKSTRNMLESNGDWTLVNGTDEGWEQAYLRVVNRQMRNSKLTRILMQNKPREEMIAEARTFLLKDPAGRAIRRALTVNGRNVDEIVEANMLNVEQVFPSYLNPKLKSIALERNLSPDDIKAFFGTDPVMRPAVNGAQISNANGTSAISSYMASKLDAFYNAFGEVPEKGLVRNPMFIDLYRKRMKAQVENAIANYPGDEIPTWYMRKMELNARQWARAEMRRNLYDTSERVESARYLRYAFPFFGAFADVAEKWGRILFDDPTVLRKLDIVYNSPDRAGMTEERDGITYINIPGQWADRMLLGNKGRPRAIPKPSLNLIFQGGEWWNPGAGWFVQYAASKLVTEVSELERNAIIKQILPYGPTGSGLSGLFIQSPALRRAQGLYDTDNPTRQNLTVLIMAEENAKYDQGLRPTKPTLKEINNRVNMQLGVEIAARLVLPFASSTRSPYQFYIDAYHTLRNEDPLTATEKFYEQYGDSFYLFTTSLSKNNTGIAATIEADKVAKQFSDLIAKNPQYGWFIVGEANAGEFSPTVYRKQFETKVAPGSTVTYRTTQDAYEAIAETNAERGWIKYNKGMDLIEAARIARGLPSLNSKGAEDLALAKQAFVAALEQENPDWANVRGKIDLNKVTSFLRFANEAIQDPRLGKRKDMQTMAEYLKGRDAIRKVLATRSSKSINAVDNADLKEAWDVFTGLLIDQDVTFNRVYTRILENDDLTKGL